MMVFNMASADDFGLITRGLGAAVVLGSVVELLAGATAVLGELTGTVLNGVL